MKLNFATYGEPKLPSLIILHGWGLSGDSYKELAKLLAEDFHVMVPDLPGFGKTSVPKKPYSVSDYVAEVKKLLKERKISEVVIIGHSFGGRIAIKLAQNSPKLVKSLILTGTPGVEKFPLKRSLKRAIYWTAAKGMKIVSFVPAVKRLRSRFSQTRDFGNVEGVMKVTFLNVVREDLTSIAKKLNQPTLLLWGARDQLAPIYDAEKMLKIMPHSYLKIFNKVGHKLPYEKPHEFAQEVLTFVNHSSMGN